MARRGVTKTAARPWSARRQMRIGAERASRIEANRNREAQRRRQDDDAAEPGPSRFARWPNRHRAKRERPSRGSREARVLSSASSSPRRLCLPQLLCIDEVGYLSYDARHADLLFEVVSRRYDKSRSILLTTNKPFAEWPTTFPNAACVVTLVDRLLHRAEVITIDGESYRLREAEERQKQKAVARKRTREGKST